MSNARNSTAVSFFVCAMAALSPAASPRSPVIMGDTLDAVAVRREYQDGNFESLTRTLESSRGSLHRRQDSLVVAKFLGVMYAANHATIEKGKYWLYKMLEIDPRAEIVDLYVSEDIHAALDRVRKELATRTANRVEPVAPVQPTPPQSQPTPAPKTPVGKSQPLAEKPATGLTWDFNLGFGKKFLGKEWDPLNSQGAFRLGLDIRPITWHWNWTADLILTNALDMKDSSGTRLSGSTSEIQMGMRRLWEKPNRSWRIFAGSGLAFVIAERDTGSAGSVQRSSLGVWLQGGVYWRLWRKWNLGLSSSYTIAGAKFRGRDTNPGAYTGTLLLGYHH